MRVYWRWAQVPEARTPENAPLGVQGRTNRSTIHPTGLPLGVCTNSTFQVRSMQNTGEGFGRLFISGMNRSHGSLLIFSYPPSQEWANGITTCVLLRTLFSCLSIRNKVRQEQRIKVLVLQLIDLSLRLCPLLFPLPSPLSPTIVSRHWLSYPPYG